MLEAASSHCALLASRRVSLSSTRVPPFTKAQTASATNLQTCLSPSRPPQPKPPNLTSLSRAVRPHIDSSATLHLSSTSPPLCPPTPESPPLAAANPIIPSLPPRPRVGPEPSRILPASSPSTSAVAFEERAARCRAPWPESTQTSRFTSAPSSKRRAASGASPWWIACKTPSKGSSAASARIGAEKFVQGAEKPEQRHT